MKRPMVENSTVVGYCVMADYDLTPPRRYNEFRDLDDAMNWYLGSSTPDTKEK